MFQILKNVVFVGDEGLTTLLDLRYHKILKATNGENGKSRNAFGKDGVDLIIKVPVGSVVRDLELDTIIADITLHGQEEIICSGGKGGRGNTAFATSKIPAPDFAENGTPGEMKNIQVELKILADVGLVGFPNVGKSTLISVISAAKPKIADYPFTTLTPNLGVVAVSDGRSFVVADLPGLIEGASLGEGLGIRFLKHIERTKVILHVLDMASIDNRDPYLDYLKINKELESYNIDLLSRPQIVIANKMDLPGSKENLEKLKKKLKDVKIIPISSYTKNNLDEVLYTTMDLLDEIRENSIKTVVADEIVVEYTYTPKAPPFVITKEDDGVYNVTGDVVKRYFDATDFNKDNHIKRFAIRIKNLGVDAKLKELGVKDGDTVRIFGYEFEFFD